MPTPPEAAVAATRVKLLTSFYYQLPFYTLLHKEMEIIRGFRPSLKFYKWNIYKLTKYYIKEEVYRIVIIEYTISFGHINNKYNTIHQCIVW